MVILMMIIKAGGHLIGHWSLHAKQLLWCLRIISWSRTRPPRCFLVWGLSLEVSSDCVFQRRPTPWSWALKERTPLGLRKYLSRDGLRHSLRKHRDLVPPPSHPPPDPQAKAEKSSKTSAMNPVLIVSKNCLTMPDGVWGLFLFFIFQNSFHASWTVGSFLIFSSLLQPP